MRLNLKKNYRAETAAHFSTFPQTEQSQRILNRNKQLIKDISTQTADMIANAATRKARNNFLGGKVNIFV